jgi:hypothetical protein
MSSSSTRSPELTGASGEGGGVGGREDWGLAEISLVLIALRSIV